MDKASRSHERIELVRPCAVCGVSLDPRDTRKVTITAAVGIHILAFVVHPDRLLRIITDDKRSSVEEFFREYLE